MKITIDSVWQKTKIEDDIILIATLCDSYDKSSDKGEIVILDNPKSQSYFEKVSAIGAVNNIKTLKSFLSQKILFPINKKYFPYRNKKEKVDIYKITINWPNLDNYASILHDTEANSAYGLQKQAIILKELINKEANKIKGNKFEITEKILGSYPAEGRDDGGFFHEERTDYYIYFIKAVRALETNGFLKILDMRFDFNAWPTPVLSKGALDNYYPAGQMVLFYPAEHCHVLIEVCNLDFNIYQDKNEDTKSRIFYTKLPNNWSLKGKDGKGCLMKNGSIIYTFPNTWSEEFRYFKCLCNNYNYEVTRQIIYEYESNLDYKKACGKSNFSKINKYIAIRVNKLRKKLKNTPLRIITSKGFTLHIE